MVGSITNTIPHPVVPLAYKTLQQIITDNDIQRTLEHILRKRAPHICGKAEDLQK